jgi:propionyl-CoA carboxylase alpha chain
MGEQAVMLAKAVNYTSAGTVECIVDQEQNFYFLEMNTRLQVEHPITEMVTGYDLVELMIRVAAGEPLPMCQEDIQLKGWAVECRVYAEDPVRDFFPSTGRITVYQPPYEDMKTVRLDSGVVEGSEISVYYDPMISKLVTKGEDREEAISAMQDALDEYVIRGVSTNINFLSALIAHPRFQRGDLSTGFIDEEFAHGFRDTETSVDAPDVPIVVAGIVHRLYMDRAAKISGQMAGHERRVADSWVVIIGDVHKPVSVKTFQADCGYRVDYKGKNYRVKTDWQFSQKVFHGTINNQRFCLQVSRQGLGYSILYRGLRINALVMTPRVAELYRIMPTKAAIDLSKFLLAPMPGLLVKLAVRAGQEVKVGEELAVIEAMKMENVLRAPADGKIASVAVNLGDCLSVDQVILEFA